MMMNINPEIKKILKQYNINEGDGILCLLSIYHNLNENIIPPITQKQVNLTKIVERDYDEAAGKVIWNVPLYDGEIAKDTAWDWIEKWREGFGKLRSDAIGNKKNCYEKMKKYFSLHPEVRVEDIFEATMLYLSPFYKGRKEVTYLQRADYFISKIFKSEGNVDYSSRLDMYLEILKKNKEGVIEQSKQLNQVVR